MNGKWVTTGSIIILLLCILPVGGSITFSGNHAVISDNRDQDRMDIAAWGTGDTAEVYIAYEDYSAGPSNPHIFFQRSINAGTGFQAAQDLLVDPDGDDKQLYPALDVYVYNGTKTIALAYLDNSPGTTSIEFYIMVQTSTDGGSSWSAAVQVTDDAHAGYPNNKMRNIDIAYDHKGNIFVVWSNLAG